MKWWVWCCLAVITKAAPVHGIVVDASGGAIQAGVYFHSAKQVVARTSSTKTGDFDVDVPPGDYLLEVRDAISFSPAMRRVTVSEGPNEVGRIEVEISGCEYPGTNCDYFGSKPPKPPAINVEDVCSALLQQPKDRWVVIVGRRSADGLGIEGNCTEVPMVDTLRLLSKITLDGPIVEGSFSKIRVKNVERKLKEVRSTLRSRGESGSIVAAYGYLSVPPNLKVKECNSSCVSEIDVAPARLIAIEAYRELP